MPPEQEKAYIKKDIETIAKICGEPPEGWYYGRLSSRTQALVWGFTERWVCHCFGIAIHTQMICLIGLTFLRRKTTKIPREC